MKSKEDDVPPPMPEQRDDFPKSALTRELIIISNEARSLAGERLKIRPEGGEKEVGR